jgi:hypothetical protein
MGRSVIRILLDLIRKISSPSETLRALASSRRAFLAMPMAVYLLHNAPGNAATSSSGTFSACRATSSKSAKKQAHGDAHWLI